ncbi:MAG: hypothetical protein HPY54_11755 [Chthonomonadetes bacterium]|nr:hypothetical protein [Chthonomonadetes bacterium]
MQTALRIHTVVLPGHRVEFTVPELQEGERVEIIVLPSGDQPCTARQSMLELVQALPQGPRSGKTWEEAERDFQEERNSWHR